MKWLHKNFFLQDFRYQNYISCYKVRRQKYWRNMAAQEGFKLFVKGIPKETPEIEIQVGDADSTFLI